jgi:hypothetical protein
MSDRITELSIELKAHVSQFSHRSFVSQWCFLCNGHWRQQTKLVKLRSPVSQLMYLMSLYHQTPITQGNERFEGFGEQYEKTIRLLNEIEDSYSVKISQLKKAQLSEEAIKRLAITNTTFLNYYLNAPLSFLEQDVDRIRETFKHFEPLITKETGLLIQDFIDFFFLVTDLEMKKYEHYFNNAYSKPDIALTLRFRKSPRSLSDEQILHLSYLTENAVLDLSIAIADLKTHMDAEKVQTMLILFSLFREEKEEILYYTDPCEYHSKPILMTSGEHIVMLYSKQLITAIYEYLFQLCAGADKNGRKVLKRREDFLEEKTVEVFSNFFGKNARIYPNYFINGTEKDLLILHGKQAYIIECKANKYRIPFRNPVKAYERISDDFKKSIGKGYQQAKEVEDLFYNSDTFTIKNGRGGIIETIDPVQFEDIFTLVVTQERFGQIQCDLAYLLEIAEDENYPWAVFIDDLETFLISLKRKKDHLTEFPAFLLAREKLHSRVLCYDEVELCSYFMFNRETFIRDCDRKEVLRSMPDANLTFDLLYQVGFGFKDELNLADKLTRSSKNATGLIKFHNLDRPDRVKDFINQRHSAGNPTGEVPDAL